MITFTSYNEFGQLLGEGITPTEFDENFSDELFANGGHVEIWNERGRFFDTFATTAAVLAEQLAISVEAEEEE